VLRAWDVFLDQRKEALKQERPELGARQRYDVILTEWREAGVGIGACAKLRGAIEVQQAQARRAWKSTARGQTPKAVGVAVQRDNFGLHVEGVD
jgi:hypothetical protein